MGSRSSPITIVGSCGMGLGTVGDSDNLDTRSSDALPESNDPELICSLYPGGPSCCVLDFGSSEDFVEDDRVAVTSTDLSVCSLWATSVDASFVHAPTQGPDFFLNARRSR